MERWQEIVLELGAWGEQVFGGLAPTEDGSGDWCLAEDAAKRIARLEAEKAAALNMLIELERLMLKHGVLMWKIGHLREAIAKAEGKEASNA